MCYRAHSDLLCLDGNVQHNARKGHKDAKFKLSNYNRLYVKFGKEKYEVFLMAFNYQQDIKLIYC